MAWECADQTQEGVKHRQFLTAEWRHLAMLNYVADASLLKPQVPMGTELDFYEGKSFVSIVGFNFLNTKVFGCAIPFHRNFEEVNLRFYVRRKGPEGWRRGVVFIRELVPRRAIALIARTFYGEPYTALPMRHSIEENPNGVRVEYAWKRDEEWESISVFAEQPREIRSASLEEFITEHYWGYTSQTAGCSEYQVEHPRWKVGRAKEATLNANIPSLYGDAFLDILSAQPASAFRADGSPVLVRRAAELKTF